ncbi:hypothetical protein ACHHYP_03653 [Achlya hypogyna]|uniref:Uncharacterized protein n=1 Tax=Achlya hypogyna TaxID=1202772 RepID=A0A1V9Z3C3_ACHHY|nr:hypothetical protein ACHHYP_03653 [Achlya hypogyna]
MTFSKPRFVSKEQRDKRHVAATTIQCAVRTHRARIYVIEVRAQRAPAPATANILDEAYGRKCSHIATLLNDLEVQIHLRGSLLDDNNVPSEVVAIVDDFTSTYTSLRSTFRAVEAVIAELADQNMLASKLEDVNETLLQVQKGCVRLARFLAEKDSVFCALDADHLDCAWTDYKSLCDGAVADAAVHKALLHCEGLFRKALGPSAFQAGAGINRMRLGDKVFVDWHERVVEAIAGVSELRAAVAAAPMPPTEVPLSAAPPSTCDIAPAPEPPKDTGSPRPPKDKYDLAYLQSRWAKGLAQRSGDAEALKQRTQAEARQRAVEFQGRCRVQKAYREERNRYKLTIWEAVAEGWPVDKISQLVAQETKKAMQDGVSSFRLRDSTSENGRTLLQLACWWGHDHLVRYFVEKGSNLGQFDCVGNRFTLLHDAARAGHATVVRTLLEFGLSPSLPDSYGDLPLHWAARRNHLDATKALMEVVGKTRAAQVARWRTLGTRNHRGRIPMDLTTSFCLRAYLVDEQDKAIRGLEAHAAETDTDSSSVDPHLVALRRRHAVVAPVSSLRRELSFSKLSSTLVAPRAVTPKLRPIDASDDIDTRRQKELRVKKATAKAVKHFALGGAKRVRVRLAGQKFKSPLQSRKSSTGLHRASSGAIGSYALEDWACTLARWTESGTMCRTVATRRLLPSALQSLTIDGALDHRRHTDRALVEILVPKHEFPALSQHDIVGSGFESIAKYLETYDACAFGPHDKWDAMRYMAVRALFRECAAAKRSAMHRACVARCLEWIERTGNERDEALRASSIAKLDAIKLHHASDDFGKAPHGSYADAPVAEQIERYQHRDLRTSHIHRVAELKEKGIALAMPPPLPPATVRRSNQAESQELERQRAGYKFHTPETDAEFALNEVWRQRREEEATAKVKRDEVATVLAQWTMDRSRDEADLLRKQESTRMMTHRASTPVLPRPATTGGSNQEELDRPTTAKSLVTAPVVIKRSSQAAAGMRFRNPLPANFKRSTMAVKEATVVAATPVGRSYSMSDIRVESAPEPEPPVASYPASYMLGLPTEAAMTPPLQRVKRKKPKNDVRGIVPAQPVPSDPEFRLFHQATTARQCVPIKGEGKKYGMSALRKEELDEINDIRAAFERHHISFNAPVFERALLTPEDRPALECIKRLPTAGSKLLENPFPLQKSTLHKARSS